MYLCRELFIIESYRMKENEQIVTKIVEGIQERKGKEIVVVDLTKLNDAPCSYFVICEGDSNVHVNAVGMSVKEYVAEKTKNKPFAVDGFDNCEWVAMDYGHVIVHVFQRHFREFYDLEHLWADARIKRIPNLD